MMFKWPIVPICEKQRKDVRQSDLIEDGLFRQCDIYRGGGGYDKFSEIYNRRFGITPNEKQFIVQLRGCPLSCPYCYVTKRGIWGQPTMLTTHNLIDAYKKTNLQVFHLMGGAPALYLEHWKELSPNVNVFHSDFLLVEKPYNRKWIVGLSGLFAVSLKDFDVDFNMLWNNLDIVVSSGIEFYITFTGNPILRHAVIKRYGKEILTDSFIIQIRKYRVSE